VEVTVDGAVEILLVEDDPDDVKLTLHALKKSNITNRIFVATDGAEALDFVFCTGAHSNRTMEAPKVVFLDIKLPKVDGLEVLRRIRADARTATLPVVLLTSSREERDVAAGYRLHANSYIIKPVDFEQFSDAIRELGMYWLVLNIPPSLADGGAVASPGSGPSRTEGQR
jgi:two-component system response regulator